MSRRFYPSLTVLMNNRLVGQLKREFGGTITFQYDSSWLNWENVLPVSLSLPLREDPYKGQVVAGFFENLLPDSDSIRKRIAERVGARGIDAYSMLTSIGRDCVGALQFIPEGEEFPLKAEITGIPVTEKEIEILLNELEIRPLGLGKDEDFRISIAGAQEKTTLLWHQEQWFKPTGTTPTTHILKPQIGRLPNGIDLSNSVENEYYCLNLMKIFGLPVNNVTIENFGSKRALVIERFDRYWTKEGSLLRLPQEDCCQALSIPPTLKYQNQGGPCIVDIMNLLSGSDNALEDRKIFFKSQILFWLIGATDGHAKNYSVFISAKGHFRLTPFYDILTAQPSLDMRQIEKKQMKLALSIGRNRHYKIEDIQGRHFVETGEESGLSKNIIQSIIYEISDMSKIAFESVEKNLPSNFPEEIHSSVKKAFEKRLEKLMKM